MRAWRICDREGCDREGCEYVRAETRGRARTMWPGYSRDFEEVLDLSVTRAPALDGPGPARSLAMVRVVCREGDTHEQWDICAEWGDRLDVDASVANVREEDERRRIDGA
jgi:hypothetical protein